jgi:hypothetical protein
MKILVREALLYTAMSAFLLCVDISALWILAEYFSWPYLLEVTVSFSAAILIGYILPISTLSQYRRLNNPPIEFASFGAVRIVGLAINAAAQSFRVGFFGIHYLAAKCRAASLTSVWDLARRRQLLFVPGSSAS